MADFFNADISLGSVSACEQTVSEAVAEPVAEAREHVEAASVAHADETGFRQVPAEGERPRKAWPWVAVTAYVTTFLVHAKRGAVAAKGLLGSFAGVLVGHRWSAYSFVDAARRQLCWAHLGRILGAPWAHLGRTLRAPVEGLRVDRRVRRGGGGDRKGPRRAGEADVPLVA